MIWKKRRDSALVQRISRIIGWVAIVDEMHDPRREVISIFNHRFVPLPLKYARYWRGDRAAASSRQNAIILRRISFWRELYALLLVLCTPSTLFSDVREAAFG